jgi:hypothetical protein
MNKMPNNDKIQVNSEMVITNLLFDNVFVVQVQETWVINRLCTGKTEEEAIEKAKKGDGFYLGKGLPIQFGVKVEFVGKVTMQEEIDEYKTR